MPKIHLMVFRKAVLNLMVAGPFMVLALLGLNARLDRGKWQFVEYGPATSRLVYAYIGPIQAASFVTSPEAEGDDVLLVLDYWIGSAEDGRLKDIPPASAELDGGSGAYQEIIRTKRRLIESAMRVAQDRENNGDFIGAARVYAKIVQAGDIAKFGEFAAFTSGSAQQSEALRSIAKVATHLEPLEKAEITSALRVVTHPRGSFIDVINNIATAYRHDQSRMGEEPISTLVTAKQDGIASMDERTDQRLLDWQQVAKRDPDLASLYGMSRVAYLQNKQLKETSMVALSALDLSYIN